MAAASASSRLGAFRAAVRGESMWLEVLRRLQHLIDVARHLDLAPDGADDALLVDEKGRALHAHVFPPIHALFDPGAVGGRSLAVGVAGERERQLVLRLELVVGGDTVARNPD